MMSDSILGTASSGSLTTDERLVLWGMRTWTACRQADVPAFTHLARTFAVQEAEAAVPTLDAVMALIHATGLKAFHHPWCRCLGDEERLLLDILALHQRGEDAAALFLTRILLPPSAARLVGASLNALAMALLASGIRLPDGRSGQTPARADRRMQPWAPSTATLH